MLAVDTTHQLTITDTFSVPMKSSAFNIFFMTQLAIIGSNTSLGMVVLHVLFMSSYAFSARPSLATSLSCQVECEVRSSLTMGGVRNWTGLTTGFFRLDRTSLAKANYKHAHAHTKCLHNFLIPTPIDSDSLT